MSHLDEGTLHAYLDGELSPAEQAELERHLSVCVPCRNALHEARGFLSEADLLVQALDAPASGGPEVAAIPVARPRRFFRPATFAWAASILLAIGFGYSIRSTPTPAPANTPASVVATTPPVEHPMVVAENPPSPAPAARSHRTGDIALRRNAAPVADGRADVSAAAEAQPSTPTPSIGTSGAGASALALQSPAPEPTPGPSAVKAAAAPSTVAMLDGVPVDTTLTRRSFGPANPPAPRRITMDEAVTRMGGTIRLIDGLAPQRVELLSGIDVPGADPSREVVRIYYEEPDLGLVTLDQQRPGPSFDARRMQSQIDADSVTATSAPIVPRGAARLGAGAALASLTWREDGTWMSLTSRLTKAQMASLQARVK